MATYKGKELTPIEDAALEVLVTTLAPDPEEYRVDEAVHPMGVHVKEVPGKKVEGLPAYKVTKVGSKVKEHGGIKVGEHLHDNHIDDLADMGHKIKTEEVDQVDELKTSTLQSYRDKAEDKLTDMGQDMKSATPKYRKIQQGRTRAFDKIQKNIKKEEAMKEEDNQKTLADYAADIISNTVGEGAFKSMVTDKMTSGKGMSYDKAVKAAEKDVKQGKNIPKTKLNKEENDLVELSRDTLGKYMQKASDMSMKMKKKRRDQAAADPRRSSGEREELRYKGMDRAGKKLDKMERDSMKEGVDEGALGTGIGAVTGAAMGGPVGAAAGGLAGHLVQKGLQKVGRKIKAGFSAAKKQEEVEQPVHETVEYHNYYDIKMAEEYTYEDFVKAAISVTNGSDDAIKIAEDHFYNNDFSLIIEEFTRSDIEDKIKVHKKAGSSVTMPKYTMKDDKMHAEFTVTDKKGMRRRHIHHGNISRLENMGKVNVSPDKED